MTHQEHTMVTARTHYLLAAAVALGTVLVVLFGIGALGIVGDGGPPDLLYLGAIALGVVAAVAARFRAGGMAVALAVTAVATVLAGVVAIAAGLVEEEGGSVVDVLGLSGGFAAMFAVSAWLFHRAARP